MDYELAQEINKEYPEISLISVLNIVESVNRFLRRHIDSFIKDKDKFSLPETLNTGNEEMDKNPFIIEAIEKALAEAKKKAESKGIDYKEQMEKLAFEGSLLLCMFFLNKNEIKLTSWKKNVITGTIIAHFTWTLYGGGKLLDELRYNNSVYIKELPGKKCKTGMYLSYKHYLDGKIRDYLKRKDLLE